MMEGLFGMVRAVNRNPYLKNVPSIIRIVPDVISKKVVYQNHAFDCSIDEIETLAFDRFAIHHTIPCQSQGASALRWNLLLIKDLPTCDLGPYGFALIVFKQTRTTYSLAACGLAL